MAGHSHWAGIKHKKGVADQKRGKLFSKLLKAIAVAAKKESDPQFNPRLRTAIEKAKSSNVPLENIERAIKKASEEKDLEEIIIEAYGPSGIALIIEAVTDNSNRTINEIKTALKDGGGKFAEPGSVRWAFEPPIGENQEWKSKFPQKIEEEEKEKLQKLIAILEEHEDVQKIYTNVQ